MRWPEWIEENCKEDLDMLLQQAFDSIDENLTCYHNFKDNILNVYTTAFEKWFLYWCKK